jgi:hypothetical protein
MGRCSWALQKCGAMADIGNFYHAVAWLFKFIGRPYSSREILNFMFKTNLVRCKGCRLETQKHFLLQKL